MPNEAPKKTSTPETLLAGKVLLRVDEVCAILSVGKSLVYDMCACDELANTRVRSALRIYAASVRDYLKKAVPDE